MSMSGQLLSTTPRYPISAREYSTRGETVSTQLAIRVDDPDVPLGNGSKKQYETQNGILRLMVK